MNDQTSYLWCYYNNALFVTNGMSNRIAQGQTLTEDERMFYDASLALHAQHCKNLLTVIKPKEEDDGEE